MPDYTLIDSDAAAGELAGLLIGTARVRPTAVVTIAAGQQEPYINVDTLATELKGLVDVYLIATGPHTWRFSQNMEEGTQVYGGAGRVYPVGHEWVRDLSRSPLRFAWGKHEGPRATARLIDDGLDMAAAAGLLGKTTESSKRVRREGTVRRAENERGWIDFGKGGLDLGVVPPQLAEPDMPIERILQEGMVVSGVLDLETRWFDIRESRLSPADALARYQIGDVVLAEIGEVHGELATARLLPSLVVKLAQADVSMDGADLRTLLTPGEVVAARVLATSPWWLTLLEADDDPVAAASIYAGGPPWLLPPSLDPKPEADEDLPASSLVVAAVPPDTADDTQMLPMVAPTDPPKPRFIPAHMPARRGEHPRPGLPPRQSADLPATSDAAVRGLSLKVDELQARTRTLESQVAELHEELAGVRYERDQLEALKTTAERHAERLDRELRKSRSALRKMASTQPYAAPAFADPERGFRYLVETAWARRVPVGEQPLRPLSAYAIGEHFLHSLDTLQGVTTEKVADVVVELLTGTAETSAGRQMHRLRTGPGGDDPIRQRTADGATCWRVALQQNTPSARRLHAWRLADRSWELSSVRKHDDFVADRRLPTLYGVGWGDTGRR